MSRIVSSSVKVGESFIMGGSGKSAKGNTKDDLIVPQKELDELAQLQQKVKQESEKLIQMSKTEAEKILTEAQVQAQQIINQAQEQGYKEGHEKGYEEGLQTANQEATVKIEALNALTKGAFEAKKQILISSEKEIIDLVLQISEKLVKCKLEKEPEVIKNIITEAISQLKEKDKVKVLVHPSLYKTVESILEEVKLSVNGLTDLKLIEDATVPTQGAIVESLESRIDARLNSQIEKITQNLYDSFYKEPVLEAIVEDADLSQEVTVIIKDEES